MSRTRVLRAGSLAVLCAALGGLALAGPSGFAALAAARPTVLELRLTGVVDPFMASYVRRGIEQASADGDAAVLLTIDTPGGLDSSMREITTAILNARVPIICYTAPSGARAASAGTFIMESCPINAMSPGTNIGAAHPVGVSGAIENEKVTNDAAAYIASLAQRWGRNTAWAVDAVRRATSASVQYAVAHHVVDLQAPSVAALLDEVGGCRPGAAHRFTTGLLRQGPIAAVCGASVQPFGMRFTESLFHAFADPNVAFLLLEIGFIALIVWVFHPGLHLSLAIGVIFTVVGFAILETLPVELVGFALLVVAAVLFVLDIKAKAHGVLTAGGVITLILGGMLLFNPAIPSARLSMPLVIGVAVAAGLFMFFVVRSLLAARHMPVVAGEESLIGRTGVVTSDLAPRGTIRAGGESWTAETAGGPIPAGTPVRIVDVRGIHVIVQPQEPGNEGRPAAPVGGPAGEGDAG